MVTESTSEHAPGVAGEGQLRDGVLYFVRSRSGELNVARYIERHHLFFAVGDSIGYFPGDLAVGNPVPLEKAFE